MLCCIFQRTVSYKTNFLTKFNNIYFRYTWYWLSEQLRHSWCLMARILRQRFWYNTLHVVCTNTILKPTMWRQRLGKYWYPQICI